MAEDRTREYAEWYVWAKRNVSSTTEICHAAAQAAVDAKRAGGDPQAAARNAAQFRQGPGWSDPETPEVRQYAEWYDWSRIELGVTGDELVRATAAAVAILRGGGDAVVASSAARAAVGKPDVAEPNTPAAPAAWLPPVPARSEAPPPSPGPPSPGPPSPGPPSPGPPPPTGAQQPPPPPPLPPESMPIPPPPGYAPSAPTTWSPGVYPAGPTGPPGAYGYPGSAGTDGFAIASLICSIIGLPAIFCYGIPAMILGLLGFFFGRSALKRIRASGGFKAGQGIATAGWIIGIVAAAGGMLYLIVVGGLIALVTSGVIPIPSPTP